MRYVRSVDRFLIRLCSPAHMVSVPTVDGFSGRYYYAFVVNKLMQICCIQFDFQDPEKEFVIVYQIEIGGI